MTPVYLTNAELEVLFWAAQGRKNKQIARLLGLSEHTVHHQMQSAKMRLRAPNRTRAVVLAIKYGNLRLWPEGATE